MLNKFIPTAKNAEELEAAWKLHGLGVNTADDIARTIVWLLGKNSRPVFGTNLVVGAGIP